jgi:lysophospholipase L1-like esterase
VLGGLAVVGAVLSAGWMASLWRDGIDPSRGYFGTDTRAHSLLIGVLLGVVLVGRPVAGGPLGRVAGGAAVAGALGLGAATLSAHEGSAWLQHGGFLLVAVGTAAIIAGADRVAPMRWILTRRPLLGLGVISYGVYLWHWPVIIVFDERRTGLDGISLSLFRLALTLFAAMASYSLLERPIRRGALGRTFGRVAVGFAPAGVAIATVAIVAATTVSIDGPTAVTAASPVGVTSPASPSSSRRAPGDEAAAVAAPSGTSAPMDAALGPNGADASPALDVIIEGDSVAHTLAGGTVRSFPEFDPWRPEQSPFDPDLVSLQSAAKPGCSFLPGALVVPGSAPANLSPLCRGWRDDLDTALDRAARPVVLVALSNDAGDRLVDGERVDMGTEAHRALLGAWLDEVRKSARARGGDIGLIALPPRTGVSAREADVGGAREDAMRDELVAYASARPGVRVLDLFEQICPGGDCGHPADGFDPAWRWDGMHYSPEGARWVAAWLTRALVGGG